MVSGGTHPGETYDQDRPAARDTTGEGETSLSSRRVQAPVAGHPSRGGALPRPFGISRFLPQSTSFINSGGFEIVLRLWDDPKDGHE
jgi:hypothetical protein